MIQELLGSPATSSPLLGHGAGDRNSFSMITSDPAGFLQASLSSFSSSPSLFLPNSSSSSSPTTNVTPAYTPPPTSTPPNNNNNNQTTANGVSPEPQNLRCPRCDSTNTKFCYYNNYNLTQPRHFCKTCRRYWTKGGALRNVPIGGGCRKNKVTTSGNGGGGSGSNNGKYSGFSKAKSCLSVTDQITGRHAGGYALGYGFESDLLVPSNPLHVFWPPPSTSSHILALLRSAQNPNPSSNTNYNHPPSSQFTVKNEGSIGINGQPNEAHSFGMSGDESYSSELSASSMGMGMPPAGSWWRSNQQHIQAISNQKENAGFAQNDAHNGTAGGLQELLQRLRSTPSKEGNFVGDHQTIVLRNENSIPSSTPYITSNHTTLAMDEGSGNLGSYNDLPLSWSRKPSSGNVYPWKELAP